METLVIDKIEEKTKEDLILELEHLRQEVTSLQNQLDKQKQTRALDEKRLEEEKKLLLQEVHHRVKNNLQIICSLLHLQSANITDDKIKEVFRESENRIRSMSLIHEKLYQSTNIQFLNLDEYIKDLSRYVFHSYHLFSNVNLFHHIEKVSLSMDQAICCGLIINELVSNSLKYAFPDKTLGDICIDFYTHQDGRHVLKVRDNGIGFPKEVDFRNSKTLGLRLVCSLAEQLDGVIELDCQNGTSFTIMF